MHRRTHAIALLLPLAVAGCPLAVDDPYVVGDGDASTGGSAGAGATACNDGAKNGDETDVDCGGGTCSPCGLGKSCGTDADCKSDNCSSDVCQAP